MQPSDASRWQQLPAGPFQLHVYHASEQSFGVTSTIIEAEREVLLVDAQFTLADAGQLVARLHSLGKPLSAVYISYGDPDYYFGLQAIRAAFPDAVVYATAPVIAHIVRTVQGKLDFWGPQLGANGTTNAVLPQLLKGSALALDGHQLEVTGLGGDEDEHTVLWLPEGRVALGGVTVFSGLHLWMADAATPARRTGWLARLDALAALQPAVVVPGHVQDTNVLDASSVAYTTDYLYRYEAALADAPTSAQIIERLGAQYPTAGMALGLQIGAKVNAGEMKW